jgi:nucleoside-diphosphate-sugar epimerase
MTAGGFTAFVTGSAGFIGTELVTVLIARGHQVFSLARSVEGAQRVRRAGAVPVMGDLLEPGRWQDEATTDWIFHLLPHADRGTSRTRRLGESIARSRVQMDIHLLDAASSSTTRRIVCLADAADFGRTGSRPITEDEIPPSTPGNRSTAALDRLDGYVICGLPVVTAFSGLVYGNGSWLRERVIDPVRSGRRLLQVGRPAPWVSPIHIRDCARALVHLAEHGEPGGRYFLATDEAVRADDFARVYARLVNMPLRVRTIPVPLGRILFSSVRTESLDGNAVLSNIRLRGLGFQFRYPTIEEGLQEIVGAGDE